MEADCFRYWDGIKVYVVARLMTEFSGSFTKDKWKQIVSATGVN